jgi:hypothetical protein
MCVEHCNCGRHGRLIKDGPRQPRGHQKKTSQRDVDPSRSRYQTCAAGDCVPLASMLSPASTLSSNARRERRSLLWRRPPVRPEPLPPRVVARAAGHVRHEPGRLKFSRECG